MKNYLKYLPSAICILYYLLVCLLTGRLGGAQIIWLIAAIFWTGYASLCSHVKNKRGSGKLAVRILTILLVMGLACGIIVEGVILSAMVKKPESEAEYVIVLGAKVNGTTPSWSLRKRIDSALAYLNDNPTSMVVASGGQGSDEGVSEGQAIANSLISKGIPPERILVEDRSTSTEENLVFSRALIESHGGSADSDVVVVTSDFHMFRALRLAEKLGYTAVSGKPADTLWVLVPQNHVREILAIGYYFVTGSL